MSRRTGTTRELVKAAVREVLQEDANHNGIPDVLERPQRQPGSPHVALIIGVGVAVALLGMVASMLVVSRAPSPPVVVKVPPVPPRPVVPDVPRPPAPPPPPQEPRGDASALALDEHGDVVAVLGSTMVKADAATLTLSWKSQVPAPLSGAMLLPRGSRLALATGNGIFFLDAASGELVKKWNYSGILEGACASGSDEVMLNVLGAGTLFFDAKTGTKVDWASHCKLREPIGCPADQHCRWTGEPCRYSVTAGKNTFASCEVDDGQGTHELRASGAVKWKVPGEADTYFGVVHDVLITANSKSVTGHAVATGAQLWAVNGNIGSALVAKGDTLYATVDGVLRALDVQHGTVNATLHLAEK